MLKKDVLAFFDPDEKRPSVAARAIGITPGAISQWDDKVPELLARKLAERFKGKLKFRPELYRDRHSAA